MPKTFPGFARLSVAILLAACNKPSASGSETPRGSVAAPPQTAPSTVPPAEAAIPAAEVSGGDAKNEPPSQVSEVEGKTVVTGCLASASGTPTRAAVGDGAPGVEVVSGAVPRVVHRLQHACCLHAVTHVERRERSVRIVEELSGAACRCQCSSTLSTELELPQGNYELSLVLVQAGTRSEVHRGPLEVLAAATNAPATPHLPRTIHVPAAGH